MPTKVLIADDEPDVLASTAALVESLGYETIQVSDASDILQAVMRETPGILLQDLKMPGLNVSGLVAALRSNASTTEIPIVFFSANTDLPATAARLDAWGYLSKPFSHDELARVLENARGAAHPTHAKTPRTLNREVREAFHDYWNLLAAMSNYVVLLGHAKASPAALEKTLRALDDVVLQLESKTDRLQTYLLDVVASIETTGPAEPAQTLVGA